MIKKIKYNYILLFLFIVSCGYQPIFQKKEVNFAIGNIESIGNEKLDKTNIEILQKIGKDNDEYYIFPKNNYQTISRWWYSENREKTVTYLNNEFDEFIRFLDDMSLEINTKIEKFVSSKDTQGNPKTFRIELSTMLKIYDSKKLIFTNNFLEISNYNNMSSKFDLKTYENKIENNLLEKISEDFIIFLETLSI